MKLMFCLVCPLLLFVLLGTSTEIRLNVNVFVDMILSIRKYYSAASVIFVHPGDKYRDYGGQSKYLSSDTVLSLPHGKNDFIGEYLKLRYYVDKSESNFDF